MCERTNCVNCGGCANSIPTCDTSTKIWEHCEICTSEIEVNNKKEEN